MSRWLMFGLEHEGEICVYVRRDMSPPPSVLSHLGVQLQIRNVPLLNSGQAWKKCDRQTVA